MKYTAIILLLVTPLFAAPGMQSAAQLAKRSVVFLSVYSYAGGGKTTLRKTGYGSGTIIGRNGEMVTNYHVVSKGEFYVATLADGAECAFERINEGYFIGDRDTDIAVMRLDRASSPPWADSTWASRK
jgi:S1-C subfamily serine protease